MTKNDKFRFFAPVDKFEKAKDQKGQDVWKVRGIISDDSRDSDGESLEYDGFDFSEFNWINWDHKKEPKFLIGEPSGVKKIPGKGVFMEGILYEDSDVAKQVVDLMKILAKGKKNKLSWSVEGQVLERDLIDPSKVKKAKITAVALCPTPKNGNTWAELVQKGFVEDSYQKEEDLEYTTEEGNIIVVDEKGDKIIVDKEGNIKIIKAQTTQNSAALIPESVEGNEKKLVKASTDILNKSIVIIADAHKNRGISSKEAIESLKKYRKIVNFNDK